MGHGTGRGWRVFLGAALLAAAQMAGCGLFDIRDPVGPVRPGVCPRASTGESESVLVNFESAIQCKGQGIGLYDETLAAEFQLVLDEVDARDLSLDSLSKTQDVLAQDVLNEATTDSFDFAFDLVEPERTGTTDRYLDMPYILRLMRRQGGVFVPVDTIQGTADISLAEQLAGGWAMTRWVDQRLEGFTSFGRWHGERVTSAAPEPGRVVH